MAIKKFVIHGKTIAYTFTHINQNLEIAITGEHLQAKNLKLSHQQFDPATGMLFFEIDGKPYKVHVSNNPALQAWQVSFSHKKNPITVLKHQEVGQIIPAVHANPSQDSRHHINHTTLKSPLAGRISKILIKPGQQVKKGQPLALIESMKMENEICAPRTVFIKTIFIAEGNVVQQNQVLIDFEEEGDKDATAKNTDEQKTV